MERSNYEINKRRVQAEFPSHDVQAIVRKFPLQQDEAYLYVVFVGRLYRICKRTGLVEWSEDGFRSASEADFSETLSLFDLLLDSAPDCAPSGVYCRINSLPGVNRTAASPAHDGLLTEPGAAVESDPDAFRQACEALDGEPFRPGDIAYRIPLFLDLYAVAQFWYGDDEFPPRLNLLWDSRMLQYVRYETVWYIHGHLLRRIREQMQS